MKSQKLKNKALRLYITNVPIYRISRQLKISQQSLNMWKIKGKWEKLREEALEKIGKNLCEKLIRDQTVIGALASEELVKRMTNREIYKTEDLIKLAKHGLEVVRPRQTTNNLNLTKNENLAIQVNIPKEVQELLDGIQSNSQASTSIPETN